MCPQVPQRRTLGCSRVGRQWVPVIAVDNAVTFRFNLRLQNGESPLFTDLSAISQQAAPRFSPGGADRSKGGSLRLGTQDVPLENGVFAVVEIPGSVFASPAGWPVQFTVDFQPVEFRNLPGFYEGPAKWRALGQEFFKEADKRNQRGGVKS